MRRDRRQHRRGVGGAAQTEDRAGRDDAVGDLDLVGIHRHRQLRHRMGHHAEADVVRLFGLQIAKAQDLGRRRVGRELHNRRRRGDVGGGVVLFGESRCAEAAADRTAQRQRRRQIVSGGQLADGGVAKVGEVLVAHRAVQAPRLDRVHRQVDIACIARPGVSAAVAGLEARIRLPAFLVDRGRVARSDGVSVATALSPERHRQRRRRPDVHLLGHIKIGGPLLGGERAVIEVGGCEVGVDIERPVGRVQSGDLVLVGAVGQAGVPGEARDFALGAPGDPGVVLCQSFLRIEALRREDQFARRGVGTGGAEGRRSDHLARHPIVLEGLCGAMAVAAEAIELHRPKFISGVIGEVGHAGHRVADDVVHVRRIR